MLTILESIEKILFEFITWIIFFPKMLFQILSDPEGIAGYVRDELKDEKENKFEGHISPIFLFLFVAIAPIALLTFVEIPYAKIEGKDNGVVGKAYTFTTKTEFLSDSNNYNFKWVFAPDQDTINNQYTKNDLPPIEEVVYTWDKPGTHKIKLEVKIGEETLYESSFKIEIKAPRQRPKWPQISIAVSARKTDPLLSCRPHV